VGADIAALVKFGAGLGAKFICLGDYANSRGAADMASTLICFPDTSPSTDSHQYNEEWGPLSKTRGLLCRK